MVLFGTLGPWLCRVIRGGIEWVERLSLWRLTFRLILTLEPKCPRTGLATAGEISQGGNGRVRDTQAVCGFRYWASNATPFFQTVNVIAAIFRARVRRAISGLIPFASKAS